MAYLGSLIIIRGSTDYNFPLKYIKPSTYICANHGQDLDSYRDANGVLQRQALEHNCVKVEFETPPMLTNSDFSMIMRNISSRFTNVPERKLTAEIYVPEIDGYKTCQMYVPDIEPSMYMIKGKTIYYDPIRFAFIEY